MTKERGSTAGSAQELKESRSRIEALISKVSDLEGANLALNQKIADLAQEMEDQRSSHRAQLAAKDDEISRLLDELSNQVKKEVKLHFSEMIFKTIIHRNIKLGEAPSHVGNILDYDDSNTENNNYLSLARELILNNS